jgi:hypothetical protein
MSVTGRFFPTFGFHLGQAGKYRTFNESTLNAGGAGPWLGHLGQIVEEDGRAFRLVKFDNGSGDVAMIDGGVLYWLTKSTWVATTDASDGEALANGVAGGTHVVGTNGNYVFVQVGGDQAAVVVAASTVASDLMTGHATTDNVLTRTAAGTAPVNKLVGIALSTRGNTTSDEGATVANSSKVRWELGALL